MTARYDVADLSRAFDEGVRLGATHMFVVYQCTGITNGYNDYDDRHYFVMPHQNVKDEILKRPGRLMEVYKLSLPKEPQLKEYRCIHI